MVYCLPIKMLLTFCFHLMSSENQPSAASLYYDQKFEEAFEFSQNNPTPEAKYILGLMYCKGKFVERDYKRGCAILKDSAQSGCKKAYLLLAYLKSNKEKKAEYVAQLTEEEKEKFFSEFREKGEGYVPGDLLSNGIGCERNLRKALEYYQSVTDTDFGDPRIAINFICLAVAAEESGIEDIKDPRVPKLVENWVALIQ